MVTMVGDGRPLFPFGVEHLHQECLGGRAAVAVLLVKVLFSTRGQCVDLWQYVEKFVEFILETMKELRSFL